jgi:hypothetical protein
VSEQRRLNLTDEELERWVVLSETPVEKLTDGEIAEWTALRAKATTSGGYLAETALREILDLRAELAQAKENGEIYKREWESCCEREQARWEVEKELQADLLAAQLVLVQMDNALQERKFVILSEAIAKAREATKEG